ncbi:hypothetical protein Pelo_8057 [Pelomyxa schiedti]|nr:hypothetical protein Pelo_8057 [Pelomyxa schiedti]
MMMDDVSDEWGVVAQQEMMRATHGTRAAVVMSLDELNAALYQLGMLAFAEGAAAAAEFRMWRQCPAKINAKKKKLKGQVDKDERIAREMAIKGGFCQQWPPPEQVKAELLRVDDEEKESRGGSYRSSTSYSSSASSVGYGLCASRPIGIVPSTYASLNVLNPRPLNSSVTRRRPPKIDSRGRKAGKHTKVKFGSNQQQQQQQQRPAPNAEDDDETASWDDEEYDEEEEIPLQKPSAPKLVSHIAEQQFPPSPQRSSNVSSKPSPSANPPSVRKPKPKPTSVIPPALPTSCSIPSHETNVSFTSQPPTPQPTASTNTTPSEEELYTQFQEAVYSLFSPNDSAFRWDILLSSVHEGVSPEDSFLAAMDKTIEDLASSPIPPTEVPAEQTTQASTPTNYTTPSNSESPKINSAMQYTTPQSESSLSLSPTQSSTSISSFWEEENTDDDLALALKLQAEEEDNKTTSPVLSTPKESTSSQMDADLAFALSLQEEEEEKNKRLQQVLQKQQQPLPCKIPTSTFPSSPTNTPKTTTKKKPKGRKPTNRNKNLS